MTTGDRIKDLRLNLGLTQGELAEKVGVKTPAIYKYETGLVVNLKRDIIEKLSKALSTSPSYLMCIDDEPEEEIDSTNAAFLNDFKALTDENKETLRDMARLMRERQSKKKL